MDIGTQKVYLLMTATIAPRNCPDAQFEPVERRRRYLRAFKYYLDKIGMAGYDGIVFAENSGEELSDFAALIPSSVSAEVELLSAPPEIFPAELRKNNEFVLLDYAVDNSKLLKGRIAGFFKVTGRYYLRNIGSLMKDVRNSCDDLQLYCDQRDHRLYSRLGLKRKEQDGETRFFFSSVKFWRENFYGYFKRHPEWRRVEDIMFEVAVAHYGDEKCRFRFGHQPLLGGNQYSGTQGQWITCMGVKVPPRLFFAIYGVRWVVESALRKVLPHFWF